ncbi:MAG: type II toxin-antitoxin system VapC family toxin [Fimbriimonadaceae bacterium]|nr:type II toxin-antitoxin system VapC family toxin [Fimbriimonadaceae bacterium]
MVAALYEESRRQAAFEALDRATQILVPASVLLESTIVAVGHGGSEGAAAVRRLLEEAHAEIIPIDHSQAESAIQAFLQFGKGRHPARLNFGDCMVYALAKTRRLPILCTGDDFSKTDIEVVPLA